MNMTEQQRRWWFATHPEFRNRGSGTQRGPEQRSPMPGWQNPAVMGLVPNWGQPILPDPFDAAHRMWEWLQYNNPVMTNDPTSEEMRKALQWAGKAAEIAELIAAGHTYKKHVLEQDEFPWIESREEFRDFIAGIVRKPTASKSLRDGRTGFWDRKTGTIVVHDPNHPDGGTAFRRRDAERYYNERLK